MSPATLLDLPLPAAPHPGWGLIVDNFAGGGGASTGIEAATGRDVDIAINHDAEAVAMHAANHPGTRHLCQSIYAVDPLEAVRDEHGVPQPVLGAWFSPDCKHFSKAKGGKPVEKNIRDLAMVAPHWIERLGPRLRPQIVWLENVEEFRTWGPLGPDNKPCPKRRGETFDHWVGRLRKAGYKVEWKELRACDYGAPTSRKRLYLIARCDGKPIVWPEPTYGKPGSPGVVSGKLKPWRTAAEIIDWSIPCPSIFERARPLKDATCRRIAHGIMRFVVNNPKPFIVPITHAGGEERVHSSDEPVRTVTTASRGELAVVAPHITKFRGGAIGHDAGDPLHTVTANSFIQRPGGATPLGLVTARLVAPTFVGCGGRRGQSGPVDPEGPYPTTTAKADACLITAALISNHYTSNTNGGRGDPLKPFKTVTTGGHHALVAVTLERQFGRSRGADVTLPAPAVTAGGSGKTAAIAVHLVSVDNTSTRAGRYFPPEDPLRTVTSAGGGFAAVAATLIQTGYGERNGQAPRVLNLGLPLGTVVGGAAKHALVAAFLEKFAENSKGKPAEAPLDTVMAGAARHSVVCAHIEQANTGMVGHPPEKPLSTIVGKGCTQRIAATSLVKLRGTSKDGQPADEPLHTVSAGGTHFAEVAAFLVKYYGNEQSGHGVEKPIDTIPTKDRYGLVTVMIDGEEYVIADIGMRMLTPRELARAQGFPDSYVLDPIVNGKPLTKTAQIRMIGNSVCPPMAEALVRANLGEAEPQAVAA
ncbi:MAG TPA: DNA cytosine methyltransferase [Allosphingosinicella sp.]|jgi:DNA (cytosine-5)-methyltransferase 1